MKALRVIRVVAVATAMVFLVALSPKVHAEDAEKAAVSGAGDVGQDVSNIKQDKKDIAKDKKDLAKDKKDLAKDKKDLAKDKHGKGHKKHNKKQEANKT